MNTPICERCGAPVPRFEVCRVKLCRDCYIEFIEMFQDFLNDGVDHAYMT